MSTEFEAAVTPNTEAPLPAAAKKSQRKGQHKVRAVIRTYSNEGDWAVREMMSAPRHKGSTAVYLSGPNTKHVNLVSDREVSIPMRLWYLEWMPKPCKNEWNTESDFRSNLRSYFGDRWYDVISVKYEWRPSS